MSIERHKRIYLLILVYWCVIAFFICKYFCRYIPAPQVGFAGEYVPFSDFNNNTFFHIENISLGFVGCFIGALTVSVFQIIFSYAQVFKFLKEMYPQIKLSDKEQEKKIKTDIAVTIFKGYKAENIAKQIVYMIFTFCIALSFALGVFLLISRWNESHYLVLKGVLLFLLIGIVPIFIFMILYLLISPGAPLQKLLLYYKVAIDEEHKDYLSSLSKTSEIENKQNISFIKFILICIGILSSFVKRTYNYLKKKTL